MDHINELEKRLNDFFGWNKARMNCFSNMLLSLITVRTVNLHEIALGFVSKAESTSSYRRIQRFFAYHPINMKHVALFIYYLFFSKKKKCYITVDRTNWYFGKSKINILTLAIAYEGMAIPLCWKLLDKAGNATGKEHVEIVKRFVALFGKDCIAGVLADREFANKTFIGWLTCKQIPFYIRVKEGSKVKFFREKSFEVKKLFSKLKSKEQTGCKQPVMIRGKKLFVSAGRSERGELLIVVTNQFSENAVSIYLRRWEIESLFQSLKGRGFRFEETHITKLERIDKLMALLAIGFSWAHKIGEWRAINKPIRFKKFSNNRRPQSSYFRYGLDLLREILLHIYDQLKPFKRCLRQILIPPNIIDLHYQELIS